MRFIGLGTTMRIPAEACGCGACTAATLTRRSLFAGAGAGLLTGVPIYARAQTDLTPAQALARLMEGNQRFIAGRLTSDSEDLAVLRQGTAEKQEPFASVLSCSDSRVPVELIFDQSIGHVFVARVAGNIASSDVVASLEYGAAVLGTKVILVLGHANCGAVKAAIQGKAAPGRISALYSAIHPAVVRAGPDLTAVIRANARLQARLVRDSSPVISELAKQGRIEVTAGYYDLASGRVSPIEL
jgi:carbonic anhydrase